MDGIRNGYPIRQAAVACQTCRWPWERYLQPMLVVGTDIVEAYFKARIGHKGLKAARTQYDAWRVIAQAV